MTIEDCYRQLGGDYSEVLKRMMSRKLVKKFIGRFLEDDSFEKLCTGISENNREEAFRAAHTLKGICLNLGFDMLSVSTGTLVEVLRPEGEGIPEEAAPMLEEVRKDFVKTTDAIRLFLETDTEE
ncbi:MAG: Hpt domain-containing protein [Candidatus Choladocola sp.]|nr:Hpt domain-containing protein [Candidatus Choladocola sp.]